MLWAAGAAAICLLICLPCFMQYKKALRLRLAACFKTAGTLCAATLALIAAIRLDPACWVCFAALILHAAADWFLEFNLYIGAGFFVAGHICYIAYFTHLFPVFALHLICVLCLLAFIGISFWRWRRMIGKQLPFFAIYGAVLSVMCGCAVACLSGQTTPGLLIAAGGALFFISDSMICSRLLFSATRGIDWAIMITYYMAQLLFGISCLI